MLLEKGAKIDAGLGMHATPLVMACRAGSLEMVKFLLERGADPLGSYVLDQDPEPIIMDSIYIAESNGHTDIAKLIRDHVGPASDGSRGNESRRKVINYVGLEWSQVISSTDTEVTVVAKRSRRGQCLVFASRGLSSTISLAGTDFGFEISIMVKESELPPVDDRTRAAPWPVLLLFELVGLIAKMGKSLDRYLIIPIESLRGPGQLARFPALAIAEVKQNIIRENNRNEKILTVLPLYLSEYNEVFRDEFPSVLERVSKEVYEGGTSLRCRA